MMKRIVCIVLLVILLILPGCGGRGQEPASSPSPTVFFGEVTPENPVWTEAMSETPTPAPSAAPTVNPTMTPEPQQSSAPQQSAESQLPTVPQQPAVEETEVFITETEAETAMVQAQSGSYGQSAENQTSSAFDISGTDENELPMVKLS